jgi:hypothetical protein
MYSPGRTERNHEDLSQDIRSPGRDLKPGPSEYGAGVQVEHCLILAEIPGVARDSR